MWQHMPIRCCIPTLRVYSRASAFAQQHGFEVHRLTKCRACGATVCRSMPVAACTPGPEERVGGECAARDTQTTRVWHRAKQLGWQNKRAL
eukprot:14920133-Alexandrium_andersonii.AAC.1